jgi:hypothetical protein
VPFGILDPDAADRCASQAASSGIGAVFGLATGDNGVLYGVGRADVED